MNDRPVLQPPASAKPAGFLRRCPATATDVFAGIMGAFLALSLLGLTIPMDSPQMALCTRPAMLLGALYVGIGPYLFANSLGKYAFAVRVVSDRGNGAKPAFWQFLARWAMLVLWPLELLVLLFAPSKKRIGDRLASTSVVEDAATKARWGRRVGLSLTALFVFYLVLVQAMQAAARNTDMFAAATAYLQERSVGESDLGAPVTLSETPLKVLMKQEKGELIVAAEGARAAGYIEMKLTRASGDWQVSAWQITDEPSGRGYSYSY